MPPPDLTELLGLSYYCLPLGGLGMNFFKGITNTPGPVLLVWLFRVEDTDF